MYSIDLGEQGVSSVPALMVKIVATMGIATIPIKIEKKSASAFKQAKNMFFTKTGFFFT